MVIKTELRKLLESQQYAFIGSHSAIKICTWTKRSLLDEDVCYKEKFYGIKSHRCCQISTTIGFCQNRCLHCWRPIEYTEGIKMKEPLDNPKELIGNAVKAQQKMLNGFPGNKKINMKKWKEAQEPNQFAISLSGEPFLYPKLGELIKEINKRKATSFVVTNGLLPEKLAKLKPLPTQIYLSVNAPNKELFEKIEKPAIKDAWERFNKSLKIFSKLKTRTALRLTIIKGVNMIEPENYAEIIKKANPMFVEVKSYMNVGYSRRRLTLENMPRHTEIKEFANQILRFLPDYKFKDEKSESRVVLLSKEAK